MALSSAKTPVRPIRPRTCSAGESTLLIALAASALLGGLFSFALPAYAENSCDAGWHAEIVSTQGTVEIQTPKGWKSLRPGDALCPGDLLRTGAFSRATVRVPEGTLVGIDADSAIRIHANESETGSWYDIVVKLFKGALHAISRDPESLSFDTPFVNAGIEGTELVLSVSEAGTEVTVLEGEVRLRNPSGQALVPGGQRGFAGPGTVPQNAPAAEAVRAVDWTRLYPPILGLDLPPADIEPTDVERASPQFFVRRAAKRLAAGASGPAARDLDAALALDPESSDALAVASVMAVAARDIDRGRELARRAVELAPERPAGWLALSHADKAAFDLRAALAGAEAAVRADPDHEVAWARLGEARLEMGDYRGAEHASRHALLLVPEYAHPHAILGFIELIERGAAAAETTFRRALELDPASWTARLGLALALHRQGDREAGRAEAEVALALNPTHPAVRSYVGKVYDAEHRKELGAVLFDLAKSFDEDDSTGWFYDALHKQQENRLVEALLDFRQAYRSNSHGRVYGARLPLDEDLAARSAGLGRLHSALGFEHLATLAGFRAIIEDPSDYSGHRLLADVYAHRPRHHIARVNEVYQALLHQPLNVAPIQPQLFEASPFVLDVVGPSSLAFQEYHPLLLENGVSVQASAVSASHGTKGIDLTAHGLGDRLSYNVGVFGFETDGFRPNNDFEQLLFDAIVQLRPNAMTTYTIGLRRNDIEKGDLALRFDPSLYFPHLRETEIVDSIRLGVRKRAAKGTWLTSVVAERADKEVVGVLNNFAQEGSRRGSAIDLQYVSEVGRWNLVSGARTLQQQQTDELFAASMPLRTPIQPISQHDVRHASAYLYSNLPLSNALRLTLGGNLEKVEGYDLTVRRFNPKAGLLWDITPHTSVRAAVFRTLQPPFISKHNIQPTLEPTHVMGFNQQYFGALGEQTWRYGAALDHEFAENLFGGIEFLKSDSDVQIPIVDPTSTAISHRRILRNERMSRWYLYWLPTSRLSFSAVYDYERSAVAPLPLESFLRLRTHRLPLKLTYFHPSGFTAGATATLVDQSGLFGIASKAPQRGTDNFWLADFSVGLRLPSRRGQVTLAIHNAFNQKFRFQDADPENPRIFPERLAQLRFTYSVQ